STGIKPDFLREESGKIQYYVPPQEGKLLSDNWMDIMLSGTYTVFDTEKSLEVMKRIVKWLASDNDIVLDFFSGSATTAHAVMQINAEDGGKRKFIMVQLPETCDEQSEAFKAGYRTICDIGKERIRRAGEKIKAEAGLTAQNLDIGFRVLKVDDTNMTDVYYSADEYSQDLLTELKNNIKPDRTDLDLLFGCLLDWG
ncbi:MAG: DNA methyltransferase, partial [Oscillospiraceae bacterium]